jgi:hypothetical protein
MRKSKFFLSFFIFMFFVSNICSMGESPKASQLDQRLGVVYYVVYDPYKKSVKTDSKPGFYMQPIGPYMMLGKIIFYENFEVYCKFLEHHNEYAINKIIEIQNKVKILNSSDVFNVWYDKHNTYIKNKENFRLFIKEFFWNLDLDYFKDTALGKKYYDAKTKEIPLKSLKKKIIPGVVYM